MDFFHDDFNDEHDCLDVMFFQESSTYSFSSHALQSCLSQNFGENSSDDNQILNTRTHEYWRHKMCDWSFEVVDHFRYDREVVSIAMNYFDRYLAIKSLDGELDYKQEERDSFSPSQCSKDKRFEPNMRNIQLLGMMSLFLAIKIHGNLGRPDGQEKRSLQIIDFVELSRGQFGAGDLLWMEQSILYTLSWKLNPPTALCFVTCLINHLQLDFQAEADSDHCLDMERKREVKFAIYELSKYIVEVSTSIFSLAAETRSSHLAVATILTAMDAINEIDATPEGRLSYIRTIQRISPIEIDLQEVAKTVMRLKSVCRHIRFIQSVSIKELFSISDESGKKTNNLECSPCSVFV